MSLDKKVVLNASYLVKTKWNKWHEGEICAKRPIEDAQNINVKEYFVHYKGLNRRYDEWITLDKIDFNSYKDPYEDPEVILLKAELDILEKSAETNKNILTRNRMKKRMSHKIARGEMVLNDLRKKARSDTISATLEKEFKEFTKVKFITSVQLGKYIMDTWYFSPYPNAYGKSSNLFVCHICLKYFKSKSTLYKHIMDCNNITPPGCQIYKHNNLALFEVDGEKYKLYSQCLCLLGKLFIDQKTVYYDVDSFLFYLLFEIDHNNEKYQLVGYFSKEKESEDNNNIACIVVFPPFQKKGYGKFLIQISYELSKREHIIGQPEKPLSYLGQKSYQCFWRWKILQILDRYIHENKNNNGESECLINVNDISLETSINREDILSTLDKLNLLNYWLNDSHTVCIPANQIRVIMNDSNLCKKPHIPIYPDCFISTI
ncbi:unnamed protein product [Gordionus sp. m RMFG-2023]|uniref:histone acetyltransferase KAT8-like n=1 Tax=Gordionus sp. m RMFG-2023 TaxID=3053472 RepID=UPI0030DE544E